MVTPLDLTMPGKAAGLIAKYGVSVRLYPKRTPKPDGTTGDPPTPSAVIKAARTGSDARLAAQLAEVRESDEFFIVDGTIEPVLGGELRLETAAPGSTRFLIVNVTPFRTGDLVAAYQIACRGLED